MTNYGFVCPAHPKHAVFLDPLRNPIPACRFCGKKLQSDCVLAGRDVERSCACRATQSPYDFTYPPELAYHIASLVPHDSHHWEAVDAKMVGYYAGLMARGKWKDMTIDAGGLTHPIAFHMSGQLQTGLMRLLATVSSNRPLRSATVGHWCTKEIDGEQTCNPGREAAVHQADPGRLDSNGRSEPTRKELWLGQEVPR